MKDSFKYIAIVFVSITALTLFSQLQDCNAQYKEETVKLFTPADSNFMPLTKKEERAPVFDFGKNKADVNLPAGVRKRDVSRVVSLKIKNSPPPEADKLPSSPLRMTEGKTVDVIETKDGNIYVAKDSNIESVIVTEYLDPIVAIDYRVGVGVSFGYAQDEGLKASPALSYSPLVWYGWLQLPVVTADLNSIGFGAQAQVYHDIYAGASYNLLLDDEQVKLNVFYVF